MILVLTAGCSATPEPATMPAAAEHLPSELPITRGSEPAEAPCRMEIPRPTSVPVFFAICGDPPSGLPFPVERPLASSAVTDRPTRERPIEIALTALVRGTTPEERARGLSTGFDSLPPEEAARIQVTTVLDRSGVLAITFSLEGAPWGPGPLASTSSELFSFVDALYATVFQFPEVSAIDARSLCWGESDCSGLLTREDWASMVLANQGRDMGPACGVWGGLLDPACRAPVPMCSPDAVELVPKMEGAGGAGAYGLEVRAEPPVCFFVATGTAEVVGLGREVRGSPIDFQMRGIIRDNSYLTLDGAMLSWTLSNACAKGGKVRVEVNGVEFSFPAAGRCDDPAGPAVFW